MSAPVLGRELTAAVHCAGTSRSGAEITARAHGAARQLSDVDRVAVGDPDPLHRLCWLLGADLAGAAALIVDPEWPRPDEVLAAAAPGRVVHGLPEPGDPVAPQGDELTWFYLPTTSGSSGTPKVLARSRRSWLRSFTALGVELGPRDSVLVPGPLSSSLHLFGALHALHQDCDVRLLPRWSALEAAEQCRFATVVHLVPAMLSALLSVFERRPELRESCLLRLVVSGGSAVDDELERRLHEVLPGCELLEYYGAAETSLIALRRGGADRLRPVVDVEVLDSQGNPGSEGLLHVRSELAFDGYLRGAQLEPAPGRVCVGDRAIRHGDGTLTVLGRAGAVLDVGGTLVPAEEVESALRGPGVLDVVVAPAPHPRLGSLVTAVVELDPAAPATRAELRARAARSLPAAKRPRRWLTGPLPRTGSGKPARGEIADRLRDNALDAGELP